MFDQSTLSQPKSPLPLESNGGATSIDCPKYFVEDFNQHAINRGQVKINNLLTVFNASTHAALKQLGAVVHKLANKEKVDTATLKALTDAIAAVHQAHQAVAGPFPPGCNTDLVDRPPDPPVPPPTS